MSDAPRILVVEDDENVRISLLAFLEADGYQTNSAASYEEAIHAISASAFQAAILDRFLGKLLGTDLITALRASNPQIVIVVVSGDPSPVPGADLRFTKSENPAVILRELRRRLGRS